MQLQQTLSIALLSLSLVACGGSLDGTTTTDTTTDSTTDTTTDTTIVGELSGEPAYFTYNGATPEWIAVKGTGGEGRQESATISFKLVDANGEAIVGEPVTFSLDKSPFGSTLLIEDGDTDDNGFVNTSVRSGIGTGPIIVTVASVNYPKITQVSNRLAVSTGLPDQDSFTLASDVYNIEALYHYDATANISVNLGGLTGNNAVPDGTIVTFHAEGGRINDEPGKLGSCATVGSECSVQWKATNPRPIDGRVTITAYATGTESFIDAKPSDGKFNEGETYTDVSEVFYDYNFNGTYDYGEIYEDVMDVDGSISGDFSIGDGKYTGVQCEDGATHCNQGQIYVFDHIELVLSGNEFTCQFNLANVDLTSGGTVDLQVNVIDSNGNIPPYETTIVATANNGVIEGKSSWSVTNSRASGYSFPVKIKQENPLNEITNDTLSFIITTPKGKVSDCSIEVVDNPAP